MMNTPDKDAIDCVSRYSDKQIVEPRYTDSALEQMGMQLSFGEGKKYRHAFTAAFVRAWKERYVKLTGV